MSIVCLSDPFPVKEGLRKGGEKMEAFCENGKDKYGKQIDKDRSVFISSSIPLI